MNFSLILANSNRILVFFGSYRGKGLVMLIEIVSGVMVDDGALQFTFIRAPGPGGQNVNKVATAVLLRVAIDKLGLADGVVERLRGLAGNGVNRESELLIKATRFRTQLQNKADALERFRGLLVKAMTVPKKRRKTRPTASSVQKRLASKRLHSKAKTLRGRKPSDSD